MSVPQTLRSGRETFIELALALTVGLAASGCPTPADNEDAGIDPTLPTCDLTAVLGQCADYVGSAHSPADVEAACVGLGGTYLDTSSCPSLNLVGNCVYDPAGDTTQRVIYSYYSMGAFPYDPAAAESVCTDAGGTFTAP